MAQVFTAPDERGRSARWPSLRVGRALLAWAAGGAIALTATALRLSNIGMVPRFNDETDEVVWSAAIAAGQHFPLANILTYIGAGFNYVLAAALLVFGPDPVLARYVVMVMGLLTVGATFLLARELALSVTDRGRSVGDGEAVAVGLLAAGLLAVSPVHILVNSRVSYAHSMTPLVTTLGLWLLVRAARLQSGRYLAASGLVFGVALQSHPTVLGLVPGLAIFVLWRLRRLLLSRRGALAILLGGLGCANLIVYNLVTDFSSIREGLAKSAAYTADRAEAADSYPVALSMEMGGFARTLAGAIGDRRFDEVPLTDPAVLAWIALAPIALLVTAQRGVPLPLLLVPPFLLILPIFNAKFEPLFNGRYFMPLVPAIFAAVGLLIVAAWRALDGVPAGRVARAALAVAVVLLLASPATGLREYEQAALAEGGNAPYYELADRIAREVYPHERALLDSDLGGVRFSSGRDGIGTVEYLLTFRPDPVPAQSVRVDEATALARANPGDYLLVLLPSARQKLETRFRLTLVGRAPAPPQHRLSGVRLYRVREVK